MPVTGPAQAPALMITSVVCCRRLLVGPKLPAHDDRRLFKKWVPTCGNWGLPVYTCFLTWNDSRASA